MRNLQHGWDQVGQVARGERPFLAWRSFQTKGNHHLCLLATIVLTVAAMAYPVIGAAYLSAKGKINIGRVLRLTFWPPDAGTTWMSAAVGLGFGLAAGFALPFALRLVFKQLAKRITPGVGLAMAAFGLWESVKQTNKMIKGEIPQENAEQYVATMLASTMLTVLMGIKARQMWRKGQENDATYFQMSAENQATYNTGQQILPKSVWDKIAAMGLGGDGFEDTMYRGARLESMFSKARLSALNIEGGLELLYNQLILGRNGGTTLWQYLGTGMTPTIRAIYGQYLGGLFSIMGVFSDAITELLYD